MEKLKIRSAKFDYGEYGEGGRDWVVTLGEVWLFTADTFEVVLAVVVALVNHGNGIARQAYSDGYADARIAW